MKIKMILFIILFILTITLFSMITHAGVDFLCEGNSGLNDCQNTNGRIYFNNATSLNPINPPLASTGVRYAPLIDDLDNDGNNEIYVSTINSISGYEYYNNFTSIGTFTPYNLGAVSSSNDGTAPFISTLNNTKYLIMAADNGTWTSIYFLRFYANKTFGSEYNVTVKLDQTTVGMYWVGCGNDARCLAAYSPASVMAGNIRGFSFNQDGKMSDEVNITNVPASICISTYSRAVSVDADDDGRTNFITSLSTSHATDNPRYYIVNMELANNASADPKLVCSEYITDNNFDPNYGCTNYFDGLIKPPNLITQSVLVSDFTDDYSGKEIVMGYQHDKDIFRMRVFSADCQDIKTESATLDVDAAYGQIKGQPFRVNAYADSTDGVGNNDEFCTTGYSLTNNDPTNKGKLVMYCSTFGEHSPFFFDGQQFKDGASVFRWNLTDQLKATTYAILSSENTGEYIGQSQILTPYGLYHIRYEPFYTSRNTLVKDWNMPIDNVTVVPYDLNNDSHIEVVAVSPQNIYVYADAYSVQGSQGAVITNIETNPCLNYSIANNTNLQVNVIVGHVESGGMASSRAVLYADTIHEINTSWATQPFYSGEAQFQFNFVTNVTFQNAKLRIIANDSQRPDVYSSVDRPITVVSSLDGQVFGDSQCSIYTASVPSPITGSTTTTTNPNEASTESNFVYDLLDIFAFTKLGRTLLYLIVMIMIGILMFVMGAKYGVSHAYSYGLIAFVESLFFIVGVFLNIFNIGLVIVIVLIAVVIIGLWISKSLSGNS